MTDFPGIQPSPQKASVVEFYHFWCYFNSTISNEMYDLENVRDATLPSKIMKTM